MSEGFVNAKQKGGDIFCECVCRNYLKFRTFYNGFKPSTKQIPYIKEFIDCSSDSF